MIQVYTGNGKGKTTAALGLAIRACGAGMKVYIGQFLKKGPYSEIKALKKFKDIRIEQFGPGNFIKKLPAQKDISTAKSGFNRVKTALAEKKYDVVILDEITVALKLKLLGLNDLLALIKNISKKTELILTGRSAPKEVIKIADLVSEIKEVKHYFKKGKKARKGIEF